MRTLYQKLKLKILGAVLIASFLILGILFFMVGHSFKVTDKLREAVCAARGLEAKRIISRMNQPRIICVDLQGTEIREEK